MGPAKKKQKLANGDAAVSDHLDGADEKNGDESQSRKSLFVRSLPSTTTTESLTQLFSESYPIRHATAVIDPTTKECRGYGFVTFADAEDAERARAEFNGHTFEGRKLRIEIAEPRKRDSEKSTPAETTRVTRGRPNPSEPPQPSRLIVRNLPWTIKTSEQLSKLFMSYGKIKQAYIPKNRHGLLAGFGFVVLRGRKNAEKALEGINGKELDGRTLAVDWAVSKDVYEDMLKQADESGEIQNAEPETGVDAEENSPQDDEGASEDEEALLGDDDNALESDVDVQMGEESEDLEPKAQDGSTTVFVRNLPFTCTDEDLEDHFLQFGKVRYARVVVDHMTERPKGTGFVCFYNQPDYEACIRHAPRSSNQLGNDSKEGKTKQMANSILQNEESDPTGNYTIDGRVLQISRAVDKSEAERLTQEGVNSRRKRNEDKRRLYLLSEGTISSRSELWQKLSTTEQNMREASAKQRKTLTESNPSLHLSLTRLSVRNIPRSINSQMLKSLAREAVVGFATDVKAGLRDKLSKEELARGGADMTDAEAARKRTGKGVVKQAKVVIEGAGGNKVEEASGAGRSRGYGFIEYYTHRCALMGLRWLNGHAVGYQVKEEKKSKASKEQIQERKKRLIVEFAIENAQVVLRRKDREQKARDRSHAVESGAVGANQSENDSSGTQKHGSLKRKRGDRQLSSKQDSRKPGPKKIAKKDSTDPPKTPVDEKLAKRNRIIGRKRAMRRARKGGK